MPGFLGTAPARPILQGPTHCLCRSWDVDGAWVQPPPVMTSKEPSGTPLPSPGDLYPHQSPPAPLTSHPDPHPQVGSEGPAPAELCPTPGRRPSPSQCRRHHALQCLCADVFTAVSPGTSRTQPLSTRPSGWDDDSSTDSGRGGWFRDGSSILPLLCTSFLGHC